MNLLRFLFTRWFNLFNFGTVEFIVLLLKSERSRPSGIHNFLCQLILLCNVLCLKIRGELCCVVNKTCTVSAIKCYFAVLFLQQYKCIVNSCLSRHFGSLNVCWLMWHFIVLDNYLPSKIYYIVFGFFSKVLVFYHGNEMINLFLQM